MKEKPLKCYVIMIAKHFPTTHPRKGEETWFSSKIEASLKAAFRYTELDGTPYQKIHTIRKNYPLWQKRMAEVEAGKAYLSLRQWEGRPYNSKQVEIFKLTKADGVGLQKMEMGRDDVGVFAETELFEQNLSIHELAKNDGLRVSDFLDWFFPIPKEPLALIHFTPFRYL